MALPSLVLPLDKIQELHIELGCQCNMRCTMCYQQDYSLKMDPVIWRERLLPVYRHAKRIVIQGGEPTVMRESRELIDLARRNNPGVRFGVMTNGMLFREDWQSDFVRSGFLVNFSLNATTRETYEKIHRFGDYEKVWTNLRNLVRLRSDCGSSLHISVSFVVLPDNLREMSDFIVMARELGVDRVSFFHDPSRMPEDSVAVKDQIARARGLQQEFTGILVIEGLDAFYQHFCSRHGTRDIHVPASERRCAAPFQSLFVDHFGKIMFCCLSDLPLNGLFEHDVERIWNGSRAQRFRRRILKNDYSYCQSTCTRNVHPVYGLTPLKMLCYCEKFKFEVAKSPRVAWRKTLRTVRKFV